MVKCRYSTIGNPSRRCIVLSTMKTAAQLFLCMNVGGRTSALSLTPGSGKLGKMGFDLIPISPTLTSRCPCLAPSKGKAASEQLLDQFDESHALHALHAHHLTGRFDPGCTEQASRERTKRLAKGRFATNPITT